MSSRPVLRNALVTGASAGIGREIVRQLARNRGLNVLATARRAERLAALASEFPPGLVQILPGDLANPVFRATLWNAAESMPGGLDLLVNNAGIGHYAPLADEDPEMIDRILEINFLALTDLTRRALRHMTPRGSGHIVQISSTLGFVGLPYSATYVASKHAVNGLVKSLRYELRGSGVHVWAACPNRTESEFHGAAKGQTATQASATKSDFAEPTERVVRGILKGLDRTHPRAFRFPTPLAWAVAQTAHWLPGPFDWFMGRWASQRFRGDIAPRP